MGRGRGGGWWGWRGFFEEGVKEGGGGRGVDGNGVVCLVA